MEIASIEGELEPLRFPESETENEDSDEENEEGDNEEENLDPDAGKKVNNR